MKKICMGIFVLFFCLKMPVLASLSSELNFNKANNTRYKPEQGPPGPPGPQGAPGSEYNVYGSFYTYANSAVHRNEKVLFDCQFFPPHGILYENGSFKIQETGLYEISYGVSQSWSNAAIALYLDSGGCVPGSQINVRKKDLKLVTVIIPINAQDKLSLINTTPDGNVFSGAFELMGVNADSPTAFMTIKKIHN